MKDSLKPGVEVTRSFDVSRDKTIDFMGEALRVYSTPAMLRDIEQTCRDLIVEHGEEGEDSVGVHVKLDHMGATLLDRKVNVSAKVTEVDGPKVSFEIEVHDPVEQVGRAKHVRFVVDTAKQAKRLEAKAAKG